MHAAEVDSHSQGTCYYFCTVRERERECLATHETVSAFPPRRLVTLCVRVVRAGGRRRLVPAPVAPPQGSQQPLSGP